MAELLTEAEYVAAVLAACGGEWPYKNADLRAAEAARVPAHVRNTPELTAKYIKEYAERRAAWGKANAWRR